MSIIDCLSTVYGHEHYYNILKTNLRVCNLLHDIHMSMVFSFKNMYEFGIFLHMGLPNTMPTPVFDPKNIFMKPNIY